MDRDEGNNTKIRHKESTYRKLYSSLLQRKKEELQLFSSSSSSTAEKTSSSDSDFNDERNLLGQIVRTETRNLFFGIATTASIFALLRFGPTRSRILGGTKAKALQQAEIDGRRLGTAGVQQRIAIFIEGVFSLWAGFRAYDYTSQQSTSSYTTVSQIPLCKGRSQISEVLCKEWIDITNNKIPNEFWKVHQSEDKLLRDDQTWTAIYQFALNCQKRHSFERQIRRSSSQQKSSTPSHVKDDNDDDNDNPIILPTKVPENTVI